jgi:hypothetical protein
MHLNLEKAGDRHADESHRFLCGHTKNEEPSFGEFPKSIPSTISFLTPVELLIWRRVNF